jgi:hypothetical protein
MNQRISEIPYDGIFQVDMGQAPTDEQLALLDAIVHAEDALERALDQAMRTSLQPRAEQMLASILNAYRGLQRARAVELHWGILLEGMPCYGNQTKTLI